MNTQTTLSRGEAMVAARAHNPSVAGSNPAPATTSRPGGNTAAILKAVLNLKRAYYAKEITAHEMMQELDDLTLIYGSLGNITSKLYPGAARVRIFAGGLN